MADLRADKFWQTWGIGTRSQVKNIIKNKKVAVNGQIYNISKCEKITQKKRLLPG